jgi:hypothetical protein
MPDRKPQINFQVEPSMKVLYEEAKGAGHWVTRLCAAGFLLMVEDPALRQQALNRLRDWESAYGASDEEEIRDFVQGAQAALRPPARGSQPARATPRAKKKAKRNKSA